MRQLVITLVLVATAKALLAQEAISFAPNAHPQKASFAVGNAWLDLRQNARPGAVQTAPSWVEAVTLVPSEGKTGSDARTVFRIRVTKPGATSNILFFRLFFTDLASGHPELVAWDESGSQLLRSGPLGQGLDVETSQSVLIPMHGASSIDVEAPGDGSSVRGVYLEWMASSELVHPASAGAQDSVPQPFAATSTLRAPAQDTEQFGTVTAGLSAEPIRVGPDQAQAATFEFGIESRPLLALLSFEVANPAVDLPLEVTVNGENVGAVAFSLPELADPGYRGEVHSLVNQMQFRYTGWVRAQKVVPARFLQTGTNDLVITNGGNPAATVIRATQIQLKYLWEESDYILKPGQ